MHPTKLHSTDGPRWNINLDRYINRFLPRAPGKHLPWVLGRFLGCRTKPTKPLGNVIIAFWAFIGALGSLSLINVVGRHIPVFEHHVGSLVLGSFVRPPCHPSPYLPRYSL